MIKVAIVQMTPEFLDNEATIAKMSAFARQAAEQNADLIVFPELILPMYPKWVPDPFCLDQSGAGAWGEHETYLRAYMAAACRLQGPETAALSQLASDLGINIVFGFAERDDDVGGLLWNSSLVLDRKGRIVGRHRKIVSVCHEWSYFRRGGAEDVCVFALDVGTIGIAICFENYQALYRRALGQLGMDLLCCLWTGPSPAEMARSGQTLETHYEVAVAHCLEVGGSVACASQVITEDATELGKNGWIHSGGSFVLDGVATTRGRIDDFVEGVCVADVNLETILDTRHIWNPFGDDARDDLFGFSLPRGAGIRRVAADGIVQQVAPGHAAADRQIGPAGGGDGRASDAMCMPLADERP